MRSPRGDVGRRGSLDGSPRAVQGRQEGTLPAPEQEPLAPSGICHTSRWGLPGLCHGRTERRQPRSLNVGDWDTERRPPCVQHRKNRPRKASLADINRAAPPYNPDTMAEVRKLGPAWTAIGQVTTIFRPPARFPSWSGGVLLDELAERGRRPRSSSAGGM